MRILERREKLIAGVKSLIWKAAVHGDIDSSYYRHLGVGDSLRYVMRILLRKKASRNTLHSVNCYGIVHVYIHACVVYMRTCHEYFKWCIVVLCSWYYISCILLILLVMTVFNDVSGLVLSCWSWGNHFVVVKVLHCWFITGLMATVDESVGRMVEALDESGQRENTIIIYMSDVSQWFIICQSIQMFVIRLRLQ